MSLFGKNQDPSPKLKSYKKDIAPFGLYFDIFSTDQFRIPIMPVPMRVDKISNGDPTLFINPDRELLINLFQKLGLYINFENFVYWGVQNLLDYTTKKYKNITFRTLRNQKKIEWYKSTLKIETNIYGLQKDFTFLLSEFLKTYSSIIESNLNIPSQRYNEKLIKYCEKGIEYFREKIEANYTEIKDSEGNIHKKSLYLEKGSKIYPKALPIEVIMYDKKDKDNEKKRRRRFIPYLIYDDLLDIFTYNKNLLIENEKEPINLKVYSQNNIIIKGSIPFNYRLNQNEKIIKLDTSKLEMIFS